MKSSKSGEFEMLRPPPPPGGRPGGGGNLSRFRYNAVCLRGLRYLAARDSIGRLFHSIFLSIINLCMYNIKSLRSWESY